MIGIANKIKYILVFEYIFEIFHNFYQIDVCEAKLSGRILCDTKYSRKYLGMKSQEDDKSNKTRHFCRYIPKMNSETKDGTLKIIGGNYFKLTPDLLGGKVDCVWDRGSLVAIDTEDRIK